MKSNTSVLSLACLITVAAGMSGCVLTESRNDIGGHLYVKTAFNVTDKDGKTKTLEAGKDYDTVLHMAAQGTMMSIHPNALSSIDALLPEPAADRLGKFSVPASASKQAFDVAGEITQTSTSNPESGSESCILGYRTRLVCREVAERGNDRDGHGHGGHGGHHQECYEESYPVYGSQNYQGIRNRTDRYASLEITNPSSREVLANFSGSYNMENYLSDKVMTSPCY
ncbi:MAG: hypothetical protein ACJ763_19565 [Bdellovibrionia bacterium]